MIIVTQKTWKRSEIDTPRLRSVYQARRKKSIFASNAVKFLNTSRPKLKAKLLFGAVLM